MRRMAFLIALLASPFAAVAQAPPLTVESVMRGPDLVGTAPFNVQFGADGRYVYFRWRRPETDTLDEDYRVTVAAPQRIERLPRNAIDTIPLANGVWSPDRRRQIVVLKGDLWLLDPAVRGGGARRRLTHTPGAETAPAWSADGRTVYFTRDNNAWALDVTAGALAQLTDIRRGPAPRGTPAEPVGQKKALRDDQRDLFDFIRRQIAEERLRADTDTVSTVKPLYLSERQNVARLAVAADGRFVLATVTERSRGDSAEGRQVQMPVWVTQSGYVETQQIRTKVGDAQTRQRAALIEVATGKTTWVQQDSGAGKRETDVAGIGFSASGRHALVRVTSTDYEDAWLVVVDVPSLARREIAHLHDDAWLDGPLSGASGWVAGSETVYYGDEKTGYAHLYTVAATGGAARALTSGNWEVQQVDMAPDGHTAYLHTNEGDFGQVHFYALDVASGRRTQLTSTEGRQDVVVSPDGRTLAVLHSAANHPPELYLQPARAGAAAVKVTESASPEFLRYDWVKPDIVMIPGLDGVQVPARLYRPRGTPASESGAAVIFVHGAGYLQNVHKWWSSYYREYMFHHVLAARGYTVLDIDYRGSAGLGRDWRTAIYRHMGGLDLDDQIAGARWLVATMHVDSTRIGIYGGSYGGFITLMAMFTQPGVFAAGAALRPVTDWAHYNHPYTARILNEPQSDTLAYRRSSPIFFAQGLVGHLLICHGMVDDNVHFQDTARLIQRLIELGKQNWEVAVYPVEAHGFRRNDSWTDEYRRIFKLFEETIGSSRSAR
ncbi:MAG TPA: prolyl oligopeptidase family serine peptidase [Gemmatimonadales bacterium]|nr:prolyl oligopeptidase family serine peptidase [Gemmatimonadales bacterium]